MRRGRTARTIFLAATAAALLVAVSAPAARAAFGLHGFQIKFTDRAGSPVTQAGSHPFAVTTNFQFNTEVGEPKEPEEQPRNIEVHLPVGFAGAPNAVPTCPHADFLQLNPESTGPKCPDDTAVGVINAEVLEPGPPAPRAIFNLRHPPGAAAEVGFVVAREPVTIEFFVNQKPPYNVIARVSNTPQAAKVFGAELIVWGDPADPVHDPQRGRCVLGLATDCSVELPQKPFVTLPRSCLGPLFATYSALSWQGSSDAGASSLPLQTTGCGNLGFAPEIKAQPTATSAETSTGLDFQLNIDDPGLTAPEGVADSDIEKAVVTLPEGVTTNPAIASGLAACSLAQYEEQTLAGAGGCPDASKVGTVEVETPLLEEELEAEGAGQDQMVPTVLHGSIYVGKQHDNPFDNLLTIYMVIEEPKLGIFVKLPGRVEPNANTGQLTTTFGEPGHELPQLPFSHFRLHFRTGPRAPLITPPTCGRYTTTTELYPYANPTVPLRRDTSFEVTAGANGKACASSPGQLPHSPSFTAGTVNSKAGTYSPFVLHLSREDGSQQFSSITTTLPEGLLGSLAGIPYCPESSIAQAAGRTGEGQAGLELAHPSCPGASQVGTVVGSAGAGPSPFFLSTGRAYLAGPYKGAPLSLEIVVPVVAGPFDLGVVAVRTALQVDPLTAQVTAVSDRIPAIQHGLPLDVRSIALDLGRSRFTLNPTSCEPKSITGLVTSLLGSTAPLSQYFQASDCRALKFGPKLALRLKGKTRRSGHPALRATLTYPKGSYANIARAQVGLPHSEFLDQGNLNKVCTQPELRSATCPRTSVYGHVKAWTPLLDKPLEGPVYLGVGFGYKLPALVGDLQGQIRVLLKAKVDTDAQEGIRSTFEAVPDAPVSRFVLTMKGGPKYGLLENSENICKKKQRATARFVAQNGIVKTFRPRIANSCHRGSRKGKRKSGKHRK